MLSVCIGTFVVNIYLYTDALEQRFKRRNTNIKWICTPRKIRRHIIEEENYVAPR